MTKVPYTNTTDRIQHVGTVTLWPGDTREVDETLIDGRAPAKPAEPAPADPVLQLLDQSVEHVATAIRARGEDGLPVITDAQLAALRQAEENGKTRKTMIGAIDEETVRRASERADREINLESFVAELSAKTDEELLELAELHVDDEAIYAAISAEIERRDGKG